MTLFQLSYVGLWVVALLVAPLTVIVLYQFSYIQRMAETMQEIRKQEPVAAGGKAPDFTARELSSGKVRRAREWRGRRHLILALSPGCVSCKALAAELAAADAETLGGTAMLALCVGSRKACYGELAAVRSIPVLAVDDDSTPVFAAVGLPAAIAVDEDGVVLDVRHPHTLTDISDLLPAGRAVAAPAPAVVLHRETLQPVGTR